MKVIAQRGSTDLLLVQTRHAEGLAWGRLWNVPRREMGREVPVDSILKFGYWTEYLGSQDVLNDLTGVTLIGGFDNGDQASGRGRAGTRGRARAGSARG